jgi:iron complex transport system ATP-binding protein
MRAVFGVDADVVPDPRDGAPLCVTYGLAGPAPDATRAAGTAQAPAPSPSRPVGRAAAVPGDLAAWSTGGGPA